MSEPREKTKDEVVEELLAHIKVMTRYWENVDSQPAVRDKLEGLAFSFLVMIDGGSMGICGFDLTPSFHPDDPEYFKEQGENWYPTCVINDEVQLHEMFHHTPKEDIPSLVEALHHRTTLEVMAKTPEIDPPAYIKERAKMLKKKIQELSRDSPR